MKKYVLDTNIYIRANRDQAWAEQLVAFYWSFLPFTFLHAVVVQELLLGAISPASAKQFHNAYIAPFERRNRIITPSYPAWRRSGEISWPGPPSGERTRSRQPARTSKRHDSRHWRGHR